MKKLIAALTVLLLLCCPAAAHADERNAAQVPREQGVAVYGHAISSKDYYEIVLGRQGANTVKLPNGITVSGKSDSESDNGLHVIIIPITAAEEADAYAWVTEKVKGFGKDPMAYYLMFYRDNGTAQPNGHITVSFAQSGKNKLRYMDGNAAAKELPGSLHNAVLSFAMEQSGYYIMVRSAPEPTPPSPSVDNPDTGAAPNAWAYLLVISAGVLLPVLPRRERKRAGK